MAILNWSLSLFLSWNLQRQKWQSTHWLSCAWGSRTISMLELREGGLTGTELTLNVSQPLTTFLQTYHSLNLRVTELDGQVKKAIFLQTHQSWGEDSQDGTPGLQAHRVLKSWSYLIRPWPKGAILVLDNCKENPRENIGLAAGLVNNVSKRGIGIVWGLI